MKAELLRIDFLSRPGRPALGIAVLLAAALLLAASVEWWRRVEGKRTDVEAAIAALEDARRRAAAPRPTPVPTLAERRESQAAELIRQPWERTLRSLERVTEPPVHLLSLAFASGTDPVRIEGEAPTYAEVLDYLRVLADVSAMSTPRLVSHAAARAEAHGASRVRFGIVLDRRTP